MDEHVRQYVCEEPGCEDLRGFVYSCGLIRHQRLVHRQQVGRSKNFCPHKDCKRSRGIGFFRKENLAEHLRRVHNGSLTQATPGPQDPKPTGQQTTSGTHKRKQRTSSFSHDRSNGGPTTSEGKSNLGPMLQSTIDSHATIASGIQNSNSDQDFWTARRSSHRRSSVDSCSSPGNGSLHGSPKLDSIYQSPIFFNNSWEHSSADVNNWTRGLPPAPIDWDSTNSGNRQGKKMSFDCEICGETIKVNRRLDWQ